MLEVVSSTYTCAHCGSRYGFFRLYCKQCGCILPAALLEQGEVTRLLDEKPARQVDVQWGQTYFHRFARLILRDETTGEALPVALDKLPVILGRSNLEHLLPPAWRARRGEANSLSRRHASLAVSGTTLWLTDLGSTNGTYLDGERLTAQVAYPVHNRAALQLGTLLLRVQFA